MPPIETDCLEQDAVLWTVGGPDDYGGDRYNSPVDIKVREEEGLREFVDPTTGNVEYYTRYYVDRVINNGALMWLGTVADIDGGTTPSKVGRVINFRQIPDLFAQEFRRFVEVMRFNGTDIPMVITTTVAYGFRDGTTAIGFRDGTTAVGYNSAQ